jgi:hypothetical protein
MLIISLPHKQTLVKQIQVTLNKFAKRTKTTTNDIN